MLSGFELYPRWVPLKTKQSGVVVVDSCFAIIVAYQDGVTNREYLLKNKPLALI